MSNEEQRVLKPGMIVKHFKRELVEDKSNTKYLYEIIGIGKMTEGLTDDLDHDINTCVVYRPLYDCDQIFNNEEDCFIRPIEEFLSEVDHEKYPTVKQKYRFEII